MSLKYGLFLPQGFVHELAGFTDPVTASETLIHLAQTADRSGYDSVWLSDHLLTAPPSQEMVFESFAGDVRVPIVQSYQLYRALKDNGVPVKFIAYPVTGHSPEDPLRQTDIEKRYVEWFAKYRR